MPFLIVFVVIPLVELGIFAAVSDHIGLWGALLFALFTAVLGGYLVKLQGLETIAAIKKASDQGRLPLDELFDGFCLVAAGAVLITPGFLTDAIGFTLLFPPARAGLRHFLKTRTDWAVDVGGFGNTHDSTIIEGEYEDLNNPSHPTSGQPLDHDQNK